MRHKRWLLDLFLFHILGNGMNTTYTRSTSQHTFSAVHVFSIIVYAAHNSLYVSSESMKSTDNQITTPRYTRQELTY